MVPWKFPRKRFLPYFRSKTSRTYLIIDRTMRYVQNTMAARRPFLLDPMQSIPTVLTSRTTQRGRDLGVTGRDGGCDSVREALVREQTHKPRFKAVFAASAPLPAPLFESPSPGRSFAPGVVARSLFGPAKPRRSRLAGNETRPIAHVNDYEIGPSTFKFAQALSRCACSRML